MENRLAKVISYLFHPLLVPLYTLAVLLHLSGILTYSVPVSYLFIFYAIVLVMGCLFPLAFIFLLYKRKIIASLYMENRQERIFPLLAMAFLYYFLYYLLRGIHFTSVFAWFMFGAAILAGLTMIISFFFKISLHMISMGALTGLLAGLIIRFEMDLVWILLPVIFFSGCVGFARLNNDAHTPSEVYSGYGMGAAVMFLLFILI